ncbi:helix-turn-helix domain-containing protein [Brevibacillus sp. SYSU BS000544]|uniref:helix-turn-helix domain-containing protein n=1 Tax=Brevibacillus sp. SYSU BS000544 TaxID=3416443 RepID=UPI003CE513ED
MEAIRLYIEEGWSNRKIMGHLGIPDRRRIPIWIRKFKQLGEFGLLDQRGRREEYIDKDRYLQKLERENSMLKKCLKIWIQEVSKRSTKPLRN